jgi:hypothetical protein
MNPFSLKAVFWREFGIFLLASSMMTVMTVPMAATMYQKNGNPLWWLLVLLFPAISALGGALAYREAKQEREARKGDA